MPLPGLIVQDDRLSEFYLHPLSILQLLLLLRVAYVRIGQLRRPVFEERRPSFCGRVPHLLCCLLLNAKAIAIIACGEVLTDLTPGNSTSHEGDMFIPANDSTAAVKAAESASNTFFTACLVCEAVLWALCAGIVIAEQRHGKNSSRTLRFWWIFNLVVAGVRTQSEVIRVIYMVVNPQSPWKQHVWLLVRLASLAPSLYLALVAFLAADTPSTDLDEGRIHVGGGGGINTRTSGADPLLTSGGGGAGGAGGAADCPPSTEDVASFASQLSFSYVTPLLTLGRKRALEHTDIYDLLPADASIANENKLATSLAKGGSFLRCWHRAYGPYFWTTGLLQVQRIAWPVPLPSSPGRPWTALVPPPLLRPSSPPPSSPPPSLPPLSPRAPSLPPHHPLSLPPPLSYRPSYRPSPPLRPSRFALAFRPRPGPQHVLHPLRPHPAQHPHLVGARVGPEEQVLKHLGDPARAQHVRRQPGQVAHHGAVLLARLPLGLAHALRHRSGGLR